MEFGTGAVKMTPAHDPNDFEVGQRHNLQVIRVINDDGTMNENAGKYAGHGPRTKRRKAVVEELEAAGLCWSRSRTTPTTWAPATAAASHGGARDSAPSGSSRWSRWPSLPSRRCATGETKFVPERFDKTYYNWMENIRDWCISRQLWWGHRIPAWYCDDCGEMIVAREDAHGLPQVRRHASSSGRGRAGHLVLLGAVALLHPGLAGRDRGPASTSIPPACWSPAMTSSSSGWRA